MDLIIDIVHANLLSPMILFFVMGILAVIVNSDLKVPEAFYSGYTMIILFTIGIKGGIELRNISFMTMILPLLAAIFLSLIMLAIAFVFLHKVFKFSLTDSIGTAAHYGSVSAVTFIAGLGFLDKIGVSYESYISAILVVMEGPAIIVAIIIYNMINKGANQKANLTFAIKDAFFGKSIFLLIGGIVIGLVAHKEGLLKIQPLFGDLFYGLLCIFLLHIGMVATLQIRKIKGFKIHTFAFAFILPIIGGVIGVFVGSLIGMSIGGTFMLGVLTASSSYIAAPAAIGHAIPSANSGIYLGSSLGLTLPFNLIVGIPLYYWLSTIL
ncbi:sodium-dependent bicarbonate transport family permease [Bacillus salitolerans]|uniref:Sodium-dependent bicarbonate transport family permease n=1 Tax=Bacillus salitolerans TaxID=1437434 RepID=A0ABW4LVM4_9BACI